MTAFVFDNFYKTTLAVALSSGATSATVASSAGLPTLSGGQVLPMILNDAATHSIYEVVYVTAISGSNLTITRAQEGTAASSWLVGDYIYADVTQATVAPVNGSASNIFLVANSTASTSEAIPRSQADALYAALAGSSSQVFNVANAATSTEAVALGQFSARPRYLFSQTGSQPAGANTTYSVAGGSITFPSFSKTGSFRLRLRAVVGLNTSTSSLGMQNFITAISDGTNTYSGASWLIATNGTNAAGTSDSWLTNPTYAASATVTLNMTVQTLAGAGSATYAITGSYLEAFVEEA
ncbi:MAG: hypothetical protein KGL35_16050 [Bradyrhizobium sp.]|nr:hypothetical protein [Bradyrhizobium sp.]